MADVGFTGCLFIKGCVKDVTAEQKGRLSPVLSLSSKTFAMTGSGASPALEDDIDETCIKLPMSRLGSSIRAFKGVIDLNSLLVYMVQCST
ncbi:hypothetical protein V6N13_086098 [Hibiscus sabdariffa]